VNLASLVNDHPPVAHALYDQGRWCTWSELRGRSASVARVLSAIGIGPSDRVAIAWPTSSDFVVAYLGVLAAGAVVVPVNPNSPPAELRKELEVVEASLLLAGGEAARSAGDMGELSPPDSVLRLVVPEAAAKERPCVGAEVSWEEMSAAHDQALGEKAHLEVHDREPHDLAVLQFTSGTAGSPRAAMLSHGNLVSNLGQMLAVPEISEICGPANVGLAAVPLFHIFGLNVALGLTLAGGTPLVLAERFDAAASLEMVRELGVTTLVGVPTMFSAWNALGEGEHDSGESGGEPTASMSGVLRAISGAAALPPEVSKRFEDGYGVPVWQGYGLTEASPAVSTSLGTGRSRPGSVGRPLPGVEVRIVDDAGEDVLQGDPGEIWVRGPNVFSGYWRDDEATASVLGPQGWLRTGDIGVADDDGDLYVVDRKKDLVIVSGFNVYPAEVEHVIGQVPGVAGVVVVGRPDPTTGESIEAVVVKEPGAGTTEDDVRSRCSGQLARYKCPSSVRFVNELPTGLAGKALRRAVRQETS
jgi:long-chain acyl-CoA synthetase